MIPKEFHHAAKKAGDRPFYVVNVVVDTNYTILSMSPVYYGATNDMVALNADEHFTQTLVNDPLFKDAEYTLKDIEGNDVIETGNYVISDGILSRQTIDVSNQSRSVEHTPNGLFSRQIESQRKDVERTFSHMKNAFAIFNGPLRFNDPKRVPEARKI